MRVYIYCFVWALSIVAMVSYPGGPPRAVCNSMIPWHTHPSGVYKAQISPSPFILHISSTDGVYNVNISSTSSTVRIRGLMVQARNCSHDIQKLGSFAENNQHLQTLNCTNAHDTVGHASGLNVTSVSFNWNRPSGLNQNEYYFK